MEEEAEKLKEMQNAVDLKMMTPPAAGGEYNNSFHLAPRL